MTDRSLSRQINIFKQKAAKAQDRAEADREFFSLLSATAAKRAAADHAILEKEAKFALEAEEPDEVRPRLLERIVEVRTAYAKIIVASLDHVPESEREIYWIAALMAHEKELDRFLRNSSGGIQ